MATFPQDVTVYTVSIDGSIAGATACCALREERYAHWIGNVNARRDLGGVNEYLVWEIVQRAKSNGFKKLDMGTSNERLSPFKSKFNPVLEPYCYVEKSDALGKISKFACSKGTGLRWRVKQILPRRSGRA